MTPAQPAGLRRYSRYAKYKDSGVDWLGEIPAHWEVKRLKFVAAEPIKNGVGEAGAHDDPQWPRYVRITDIAGPRELREDTFKSLPPELAREAPFKVGDLLLAAVGATFGKSYLHARDCGPVCFAGYMVRFSPGRKLEPSYAAYWTESAAYWALVQSRVVQATIQNFSAARYKELSLPLASGPEQRAIAAFLDRETARIDALVAKKERLIELLQEQRTALITRAVTRGLDPNVPMKDSGLEWLGQVPSHWYRVAIGRLARIGNGSTPNRDDPRYWADGSTPWLTSGKINDQVITLVSEFVTELALRECHLPRVPAGSVLVAITGEGQTRGRAALLAIDSTINQHLAYITPRDGKLRSAYLRWVLESRYDWLRFESGGAGSTRAALTCEFLKSVEIMLPPTKEQDAIVVFLDRETARIDSLITKVRNAIERLKELRTALISAAVTGKIDVREDAA